MAKKAQRAQLKKRKRRKRIILTIFIPLLLIIIAVGVYGAYLVKQAADAAADSQTELNRGGKSEKRIDPVDPKHDNISILFMGIDDSNKRSMGDDTRTDALILATLNESQKSVKMVSIPRDSLVYDPIRGVEDKINHAHAYNGADGTIATVEELFDIPVDYMVRMNFEAFIDVVDALGGVQVDVPVSFSEQNSKDEKDAIHLEKGLQHLDGEQALALARTRKIDNDIERGKRQQLVLKAIIEKAASFSSITKYSDVITALGDNITTNLSFGEMISLHDYATSGQKLQVDSLVLQGSDLWTDHGYYYQLDQNNVDEIKTTLREHLDINELGERNDASSTAKNKN
ncbi:LCP family protein [Bacillus timonensis]|uniref:LCP family protein n=1 Tax=Bacillus timonensis TaxID=1033734 RepID=UPI00028982E3|nr:LCP family protein [Bacillus timonensis]